ncbi:hypothetical protein ACHQM5_027759 [Ranunculus cassubicifolius]
MAKNNLSLALLFLSAFLHILLVHSQTPPLAPATPPLAQALYIFGDSLEDSGNNNFLQTTAKVNYTPYGVDFPSGPTGRFTNGKTNVDFIAILLGLPLVRAYLGLSAAEKRNLTTGVNYASGAGGILRETGTATGDILSLDEQIEFFERTLINDLLPIFRSISALRRHLSKSIFWVALGNNDYINNYLQPASYPSSTIFSPQQFADRLIHNLQLRITRLYLLGARKFVVFNIGRIGCVPALVNTANPRPTTACVEAVNDLVMLYNTRFPGMIASLERGLVGSIFVRGDAFTVGKTSAEIGLTTQQVPCCPVSSATGLCLPNSIPCTNRDTSIFWDAFHTTEIVNSLAANDCFNGSTSCTPINVRQLAQI